MGKDHIGYDELVDNALRGAMREVLLRVAENGLLGGHHLYITLRTGFPGVDIPGYLSDRYPDELTIVLQHQFWGLEVTEEGFSVTLSFNKAREHISIPFAALTRFADPGAKFGLQFESQAAARSGKLELVADRLPGSDGDDDVDEVDGEEGVSVADGMIDISGDVGDDINVSRDSMTRSFAADTQEANGDAVLDQAGDEAPGDDSAAGNAAAEEDTEAGAEVVTLDSFRKK